MSSLIFSNLLMQTIRGSLPCGFLVFGWIILFQGELLSQPQPRPEKRSAIHPLPLASVDAKGSAWLEAGGLTQAHWMYQAQLSHPDGHTYFLAQPKSEAPTPPGKETGFNLYRTLEAPSEIETFATGFRQPFALVMDDWGNLFVMDALGPQAYGARWLQIFQGAHYGWHTIDEPVAGYFQQIIWEQEVIAAHQREDKDPLPFYAVGSFQGIASNITHPPHTSDPNEAENANFLFIGEYNGQAHTLIHWQQSVHGIIRNHGKGHPLGLMQGPAWITWDPRGGLLAQPWPLKNENKQNLDRYLHNSSKKALQSSRAWPLWPSDDWFNALRSHEDLIPLLESPHTYVRRRAQDLLEEIGQEALIPLMQRARNPRHSKARLHALWAIGNLDASSPVNTLQAIPHEWWTQMLMDPDSRVGYWTSVLASRLQGTLLSKTLTDALQSAQPLTQIGILQTLHKLKISLEQEQIQPLLSILPLGDPVMAHAMAMATHPDVFMDWPPEFTPMNRQVSELRARSMLWHAAPDATHYLEDTDQRIRLLALDTLYPQLPWDEASLRSKWRDWLTPYSEPAPSTPIERPRSVVQASLRRYFGSWMGSHEFEALSEAVACLEHPHTPELSRKELAQGMQVLLQHWVSHEASRPDRMEEKLMQLFSSRVNTWMRQGNEAQRGFILEWAAVLNRTDLQGVIEKVFYDFHESDKNRQKAFQLLAAWDTKHHAKWVEEGLMANRACIRFEAIILQSRLNPGDQVAGLVAQATKGSINQQMTALNHLAQILDPRVDFAMLHWLEIATLGRLDPRIKGSLQQAASRRSAKAVKEAMARWQQKVIQAQPWP